jgi:hypothetical protein
VDRARLELARVQARQRSRARDLAVAAWGARGADGVLTPGGTSWWRGSDGQKSGKGGSGGASSMRRCSRREREERGAEMSAVKMAGGVAPFYSIREAVEGSGEDRPARWVLIPVGFRRI